jgi:Domain of unknown function (DUF4398)
MLRSNPAARQKVPPFQGLGNYRGEVVFQHDATLTTSSCGRSTMLETKPLRYLLGASVLLGMAACASGPPADDEIAAAEVGLTEADDAGAAERAPADLALAKDKLERARAAAAAGDNTEAARLAEEALADAQLAAAEARSEVAREHADELRASIQTLRDEVVARSPSTS